ncbi:O-acetyl-ADP-ribose deacetylase [Rhizosphaericola mali]|uniref:O-acetyl-ADP-ribose deacetylase n=1 Tax=Rhizosphaericola mali TaxID=2545455 RepID=A0A5P2G5R5_9BACT|nr:O-acetyl-ADP-ribose deacetylase [Rhizosphaericola mali]
MIEVQKGDITKIKVDAIVNAANTSLLGGGGVDGAIHRAGGNEILEDCRKIILKQGGCKVGEAVITTAGKLPAKYVIHTVGPVWNSGMKNEEIKLKNCYLNSLNLAAENNCKTIAFPSISTGIYRFPKDKAATIAVETIKDFLKEDEIIEKIILVSFDDENYRIIKLALDK